MKYSEILAQIDNNLYYLMHHNKNTTKKQDAALADIGEAWQELKYKIGSENVKL